MRKPILSGIILWSSLLVAQSKQDYNWIFSNNTEATEGFEAYGFNFLESDDLQSWQGIVPIKMSGLNASICDKDGHLLLYTNGCTVVDRHHNVMPNGEDLNNEDYFESIGDLLCIDGYVGKQGIIILPDPGEENGYYIFHKPFIGEPDGIGKFLQLRMSYVDMRLNNGLGDITFKNIVIDQGHKLLSSYLTAINHENGKDWWIINPIKGSNEYLTYLLTETGLIDIRLQKIGPDFHWNASGSGRAVFSPDGTMYAYYNRNEHLFLYDFDRSTGELSDLRQLALKAESPFAYLSSIEFSPDSRFLYVAARDSLFQVDTYEEELEEGATLIDVWDETYDPFATTFTIMAMAPNCKIYLASGSGTNTYHVINKPNEKGLACDFVQRGIQLPHTSSVGNMPNFPRFRVDEDEKCDPNITSVFGQEVYYRSDLTVYPNPVMSEATVELPEYGQGWLSVYSLTGERVSHMEVNGLDNEMSLDMGSYPPGQYTVEYIPTNNNERLVWSSVVMKVAE